MTPKALYAKLTGKIGDGSVLVDCLVGTESTPNTYVRPRAGLFRFPVKPAERGHLPRHRDHLRPRQDRRGAPSRPLEHREAGRHRRLGDLLDVVVPVTAGMKTSRSSV